MRFVRLWNYPGLAMLSQEMPALQLAFQSNSL